LPLPDLQRQNSGMQMQQKTRSLRGNTLQQALLPTAQTIATKARNHT
jgi:hypothetical protein